jgi:hypothetical protein
VAADQCDVNTQNNREAQGMPVRGFQWAAAGVGQSPAVPLRERQRHALRTDIQQAALRMFAAQRFDNVTTETIAEEVGISPSTFFRHGPSKEHLLLGATHHKRKTHVSTYSQPHRAFA